MQRAKKFWNSKILEFDYSKKLIPWFRKLFRSFTPIILKYQTVYRKKHGLNGNFHICTDYYSISNDQTGQLIHASKFIKIDFRFSTDLEDSTDSGWIRDGLKMWWFGFEMRYTWIRKPYQPDYPSQDRVWCIW